MCSYFDDTLCGHGYDWAIEKGLVTDDEAATVVSLHHLLEGHEAPEGNDHGHKRILDDPAWVEIGEEATRATSNLAALLSPAEKNILLGHD